MYGSIIGFIELQAWVLMNRERDRITEIQRDGCVESLMEYW